MLRRRWAQHPDANVVLATGHTFDVFDVPAPAGVVALASMNRSGIRPGPVATAGHDRYLFFVGSRGVPDDEDEWWSSDLDVSKTHGGELRSFEIDARPESVREDLRWHCRNSYVVAPPSPLPAGQHASWIRRPDADALPEPVLLLEILADACDALGNTRGRGG